MVVAPSFSHSGVPSPLALICPILTRAQMIPAIFLGVGIPFLPYSPRWLAGRGRDEEALQVLCKLRGLDTTDERVIREWVEIRSEVAYCNEVSIVRHPNCQDGSWTSRAMLHVWSYLDCFRKGCWKRTHVGIGLMFFQREYLPVEVEPPLPLVFPHYRG